MAWIVSKIIGDGKSTDTPFTTAAQQYGLNFIDPLGQAFVVDSKTGQSPTPFRLFQVPDGTEQRLQTEVGACIMPAPDAVLTNLTKTQLMNKLFVQGCDANILGAQTGADALALVQLVTAVVGPSGVVVP